MQQRYSVCRLGSHISERKLRSLIAMHQVMFLFDWTEQRYCDRKYNQGLAYLNEVSGDDEVFFKAAERSSIFWGWWKNHWDLREEEFIREVETERIPPSQYLQRYTSLHDGRELANGQSYHGEIMDSSYAQLVPMLIKSHQRAYQPL